MSKYYIWTIGCQMNKAESERLGVYLEHYGYQATPAAEDADIIVLNSCVVRQSAENRVVNKIATIKTLKKSRPGLVLAVTGCLVNSDTDHLNRKFPQVDYFFKAGDCPPWLAGDVWPLTLQHSSVSTFVPIMQGCNNFCSYCIVPLRRGRERGRPVDEIICEVRQLASIGTKEVILLGQNVDSYGHDLPDKPDLADLLGELNGIGGLARIRFLTNHPKDMSQKLISSVASLDKVCEQISLPVQSGDNNMLKAMRRGYTIEHFRELVGNIRNKIPGIALSTDVIVGFPSEGEVQFQHTFDLLAELKFDAVHIAAYSPRPGTLASKEFEDNVPSEVKKGRLEKVERLQAGIATEINSRLLNKMVEVLVEGRQKGKWYGRTRTDKLVFFSGNEDYTGKLVNIIIKRTSPWSLTGEIAS